MCIVYRIVSGSIAAATQAAIGNAHADSLFAIAQSTAMANGRADSGWAAITARSAATGLAVDNAAVHEEE
jgi:hypothetical protein